MNTSLYHRILTQGSAVNRSLSFAIRHMSTKPKPGTVSNISPSIEEKVGRNLHRQVSHPVNTIKNIIFDHVCSKNVDNDNKTIFKTYDNFSPYVTVKQNFEDLLIPEDHPSRSPSDTFYLNTETILRPHTSAHQTELLRRGERAFLVAGDCFRRDEIDSSHYPVFHQMEGVRIWKNSELPSDPAEAEAMIMNDLKTTLEGVARKLFGDVNTRWIDAYFPFTTPSTELEVEFEGRWLEVLGCGKVHPNIMNSVGLSDHQGWAFGLGLDRLAMVLFNVPDIRLFWSTDSRFLSQFEDGEITTFVPFSKYPPTDRDVSFWYNPDTFHDNDFFALVREFAGDEVENVELKDSFIHPKTGRHSKMFRITYRSLERTLVTEEVNEWQEKVRLALLEKPGIELR